MGNILCRDKTPRRVYVKGPIKGTDKAFDPQLFSNDSLVNGTRKDTPNQNSNNKMFFSTPNLNNNDMKSTISLDARIFDSGSKNPPIAPPRKRRTLKKGSTLPTTMPSDGVRNGFKDVFGNSSISSSNFDDIDFIDKEDNSLQERPMAEQRTSTPEKKLRIGNRKSDKFFGEALSDHLSDEPVSPIPEKDEKKEEEVQEDDSKTISDKKLSFFLMNMLDDIRNAEDEEKYKGQEPADEPPFIAKKKVIKHICDDDDHMHHKHMHKKDESAEHAPPKPDRDFSKFREASHDLHDEIIPEKTEVVQAKVIIKRGLSRDNLPSPPATPSRKKGVTSLPTTPTITIETIDASMEKATIDKPSEPEELPKEPSKELVDEVIKKAYGMSDFNYHPEDLAHTTHDDGSNLVRPTSQLAVRKISTPRKISTESAPSIDSETMSVKVNDLSVPSTPYKKSSFCENEVKLNQMLEESHAKFYEIDEAARVPSPIARHHTGEKVVVGSSMNDMIDEIYSKNSDIMKEFQSFLEQSIETRPVLSAEDEKKFLEAKKSLEQYAVDPVKDTHEDDFDNRSYSDSFESTDNEDEIENVHNKPQQSTDPTKRRESIENVDNWFSHHIEMEQNESDVCNSRGSEQRPSGYDTHKIFPFGNTIMGRRDSQSDEFFTDTSAIMHRIKAHIESVQDTESIIAEENEDAPEKEAQLRESSPDHSTLLKYLDKNESTSAKN